MFVLCYDKRAFSGNTNKFLQMLTGIDPSSVEKRPPLNKKKAVTPGQIIGRFRADRHIGFRFGNSVWEFECIVCGHKILQQASTAKYRPKELGMVGTCNCKSLLGDPIARYWKKAKKNGEPMCGRWSSSLDAFIQDVGKAPRKRYKLMRYPDENGAWEPGNVIWVPATVSRLITFNGETKSISEWAREIGITRERMRQRLDSGPVEEAITTKAGETRNSKKRFSRKGIGGRKPKYNWQNLLNGGIHKIHKDELDCKISSFRAVVYAAAKTRGKKAMVNVAGTKIFVQAIT